MASEEQLHRILQQIQTQALVSQRQLNVVKAQIANKERENTMQGLTLSQLEAEKTDARLYRGVGKMFVSEERGTILAELRKRQNDAKEDVAALSKKQKFLEKQVADSQAHLKDLFSGMSRASAQA